MRLLGLNRGSYNPLFTYTLRCFPSGSMDHCAFLQLPPRFPYVPKNTSFLIGGTGRCGPTVIHCHHDRCHTSPKTRAPNVLEPQAVVRPRPPPYFFNGPHPRRTNAFRSFLGRHPGWLSYVVSRTHGLIIYHYSHTKLAFNLPSRTLSHVAAPYLSFCPQILWPASLSYLSIPADLDTDVPVPSSQTPMFFAHL